MPFFAGLDPATLNQLLADLEPVHLPGGALLFAADAAGDSMYVVLSGRLRVTIDRNDGAPESLRELARGETVGELALLTGESRSATVSGDPRHRARMNFPAAFESAVQTDPKLIRANRRAAGRPRTTGARRHVSYAQSPHHRSGAGSRHVRLNEFVATLTNAMRTAGATLCLRRETLPALCGLIDRTTALPQGTDS